MVRQELLGVAWTKMDSQHPVISLHLELDYGSWLIRYGNKTSSVKVKNGLEAGQFCDCCSISPSGILTEHE